jgi:hypothetical protein
MMLYYPLVSILRDINSRFLKSSECDIMFKKPDRLILSFARLIGSLLDDSCKDLGATEIGVITCHYLDFRSSHRVHAAFCIVPGWRLPLQVPLPIRPYQRQPAPFCPGLPLRLLNMSRTTSLANREKRRERKAIAAAKKATAAALKAATKPTTTSTKDPPAKRARGAQPSFEPNKALFVDRKLAEWTKLHDAVSQKLPGAKSAMSAFYDRLLSEYLLYHGRTYTNSLTEYPAELDDDHVHNKIREVSDTH